MTWWETGKTSTNTLGTGAEESADVSVEATAARPKEFRFDAPTASMSVGEEDRHFTNQGRDTPSLNAADDEAMASSDSSLIPATHKFKMKQTSWLASFKTTHFWIVLVLGQILSLAITGANTTSTLLADAGVSIPAFQLVPNYLLLNIVFTGFTLHRYGLKKYATLLKTIGWRYVILSFMDVLGNYFIVLSYRYTTILSAQLINFWATVVVVTISFVVLKVRYQLAQYAGILICVGGMGILIVSDHLTRANSFGGNEYVKGDLFALLGATFYGLCNVFEEFLVSKRPMYEVIGQLGFWGVFISGTVTAIFDRSEWGYAKWTPAVGGYFAAFTIILFLFYSLVPMLFRLSSAAFFNISLLTANFWGVIIGIQVFGYNFHWLYPIAFFLIIIGLVVYFAAESVLGEARKPWLGDNDE